ncbi:hypothetical protein OTBS_1921 [Orientia tsutsugamushi str. Boryong]|uniref:Uncharacterized protein n=1 Tax=Orientia tsutsugamushi (strain Boryong) TaxID=357244 RepID=A5CF99_ORITB|nr:hypothetical protein OTBS_1921 [Orientia tsutsugamushi str. Boryong]
MLFLAFDLYFIKINIASKICYSHLECSLSIAF